jgi:hypothetical protein
MVIYHHDRIMFDVYTLDNVMNIVIVVGYGWHGGQ